MLKRRVSFKVISVFLAGAFFFSGILGPHIIMVRSAYADLLNPSPSAQTPPLPAGFIPTTSSYKPWALKGIKIYPDDPLKFDFLLEEGDAKLSDDQLKNESALLIKYFLAALTLPEEDLWVNLSPFEQDKIIPQETSLTEMGRGLLEQDYLLKKLVSSMTYPESGLGESFWQKVYEQAYQRFGTTKIPINTFNKVWIVPDKAVVYEDGERALIDESKLKVMMEADYLAFKNRNQKTEGQPAPAQRNGPGKTEQREEELNNLSSQVMKEVVIPALEEEVNSGENFATLRKMYRSFILATWFKKRLKESLLGQVYVNQKKTKGIDIDEPQLKEKVYQQYLQSYKDGLYNYIRTDYSPQEKKHIKRKYWSGGVRFSGFAGSPVVQMESVSSPLVSRFWEMTKKALLVGVILTTISLSSGDFNSVEAAKADLERMVPLKKELFSKDSLRMNPDIRYVRMVEAFKILRNIEELSRTNPEAMYNFYLMTTEEKPILTIDPEVIKLLAQRKLIAHKIGGGSLLLGTENALRPVPANNLIKMITRFSVTADNMFNMQVVSPFEGKTFGEIRERLKEVDAMVIDNISNVLSVSSSGNLREIIEDYLVTSDREGAVDRFKEHGFDKEEAKRILALARALEFTGLEYPDKFLSVKLLYQLLKREKEYSVTVQEILDRSSKTDTTPFTVQDVLLILDQLSEALRGASSPLANESAGAENPSIPKGEEIIGKTVKEVTGFPVSNEVMEVLRDYFSDVYDSFLNPWDDELTDRAYRHNLLYLPALEELMKLELSQKHSKEILEILSKEAETQSQANASSPLASKEAAGSPIVKIDLSKKTPQVKHNLQVIEEVAKSLPEGIEFISGGYDGAVWTLEDLLREFLVGKRTLRGIQTLIDPQMHDKMTIEQVCRATGIQVAELPVMTMPATDILKNNPKKVKEILFLFIATRVVLENPKINGLTNGSVPAVIAKYLQLELSYEKAISDMTENTGISREDAKGALRGAVDYLAQSLLGKEALSPEHIAKLTDMLLELKWTDRFLSEKDIKEGIIPEFLKGKISFQEAEKVIVERMGKPFDTGKTADIAGILVKKDTKENMVMAARVFLVTLQFVVRKKLFNAKVFEEILNYGYAIYHHLGDKDIGRDIKRESAKKALVNSGKSEGQAKKMIEQAEKRFNAASSSPLAQEGAGEQPFDNLPEEIKNTIQSFSKFLGPSNLRSEAISTSDLQSYRIQYIEYVLVTLGSYLKKRELGKDTLTKIKATYGKLERELKGLKKYPAIDDDYKGPIEEEPPDPTKDYWGFRKWQEDKESEEVHKRRLRQIKDDEDWFMTSASPLQLKNPGGIDLNYVLLDLKTSGKGFTGYDPEKLREISANIAGFKAEIISIKRSEN